MDPHGDLPLNSFYQYNTAGAGVHVYVIDTGIRATHLDFGGRASLDYTAVNDGNGASDCNGHGTHVSGTIGGATWGVAKGVRLHSVRVFGCSGGAATSTIIGAVDWVTVNHANPAVVNMSLGGGASQAMDDAINNSIAAGVVYAVAAGNDFGGDACNMSPARVPAAITVGSTESDDSRSWFSNIGACVDLFAPGGYITSAGISSDTATAVLSGTSMATPHVAGAAALFLGLNPRATPAQVASALTANATGGHVRDAGAGSPNALLYTAFIGTSISVTFWYAAGTPAPSWCPHGAAGCLSPALNGVVVGDFNGDGKTDFMSANGNFDAWLSNGDGSFRYGAGTPGPSWCGGAYNCVSQARNGVVTGDFNGDGKTDFMSANGNFDTWLSNGDGSFRYAAGTPAPGWCSGGASGCLSQAVNGVVVGDFNRDGKTDFMSANGNFDTWLSNGDGSFRYAAGTPAPGWCSNGASGCLSRAVNGTVVGDFNGDGKTDFMSANGNFDTWLSNGDGSFGYAAGTPAQGWCSGGASGCLSQAVNGVVVGDFNRDGKTDFMSANGNFDTWLSNGDGTFSTTATAPPAWCGSASACVNHSRNGVVVGDFDGDGRRDFMSANGNFDTWLSR